LKLRLTLLIFIFSLASVAMSSLKLRGILSVANDRQRLAELDQNIVSQLHVVL
jgi:hypothetical protein